MQEEKLLKKLKMFFGEAIMHIFLIWTIIFGK
ncbi:hypothetical protein FUSO5_01610 [Fusobacterium necrophorum BFTR-1]|nr:hypothetical protein FUSO5_01610 [Fusobacterium necrophorum BFTR-1]